MQSSDAPERELRGVVLQLDSTLGHQPAAAATIFG